VTMKSSSGFDQERENKHARVLYSALIIDGVAFT